MANTKKIIPVKSEMTVEEKIAKMEETYGKLVSKLQAEITGLKKDSDKKEYKPKRELIKDSNGLINPLINKKVTISLIENRNNSFHKNKNQATLLSGASSSFKVPVNGHTGNLVNPLNKDERAFLENELGLNLGIHIRNTSTDPSANFWTTKKAKVNLRKPGEKLESADLELDLSDPYDFIKYKIALVSPRVANNWEDRYSNGEFEFMIVDGDVEMEETLKFVEIKDKVIEYLFSIKNNKRRLFNLIRLYGAKNLAKAITYSNSIEKMYLELRKLTDSNTAVQNLYSIISQGTETISNKIFLQDALTCGIIVRMGAEYTLKGGAVIGYDDVSAIGFLLKPINQSIKLQVTDAIDKFYTINE